MPASSARSRRPAASRRPRRASASGQPALSKITRRIEDEFGEKLFERSPQGVTLTPFGRAFLDYAKVVERETQDLANISRALRAGESGLCRIGAGQTWAHGLLPAIVAKVNAMRPNVAMSIVTGSVAVLLEQLLAGQLDLAFVSLEPPLSDELDFEALNRDHKHIVARRDHPSDGVRPTGHPGRHDGFRLDRRGAQPSQPVLPLADGQRAAARPRAAERRGRDAPAAHHARAGEDDGPTRLPAEPDPGAGHRGHRLAIGRVHPGERDTGVAWRKNHPSLPAVPLRHGRRARGQRRPVRGGAPNGPEPPS